MYGVLLGPALQALGQPAKLAAILWSRGILGVATLAAVGTLLNGRNDATEASVVALAGIGMQLVVNTASIWVTVHRAIGASVARFLAPTLPAVLAAITAALVPLATDRLGVNDLNPLLSVLVLAAAAGLVAGALLWITDRRARQLVLSRLRRRPHPRPHRLTALVDAFTRGRKTIAVPLARTGWLNECCSAVVPAGFSIPTVAPLPSSVGFVPVRSA